MAFYTRTIELDGVSYKQIGPSQWQNLKTSEIIDNTKLVVLVNEFKQRKIAPITPSGGTAGACCEVVNGVMQCSSKSQEACSGGCFKGEGTNCFATEENPNPCSTCVHCCFVGAGCFAKTPSACLAGGGTYFAFGQGCTACKFGVCSTDSSVTERFYGNGCTGTFIVGGGPASFDQGVFCTGSGLGQTCFGLGQRYQELTPNFISGATCSACILGSCCTGGTCFGGGLTSQAACSSVGGLFYPGQTCGRCDVGVYCTGAGINRTCIRTGYRGESLSSEFQQGATCSYCTMGTCCVNGDATVGVRQTNCAGTFFAGIFDLNACNKGSCCVGATCTENVFRYDCAGVFNNGLTCIACSNGACCLPGGGCTLTSMGTCMATGGVFFGGATCSACDNGVCCNNGTCTNQKRGVACSGTFFSGEECSTVPCKLGACCTGGTCIGNIENARCDLLGGVFFGGYTCFGCATGANCLSDFELNGDRVCSPDVFYGDVVDGSFYQGQGCSACQSGACCNTLGGGSLAIRGDCTGSTTFYAGKTLSVCDAGVFCTGSNAGQTCFGLGHRGQSLTNNFIAGGNCSSCILGACCTGGTCLGGGLTSQAACAIAGGLFYAGATCTVCDYGVYCTGATCLSLGYRGQSFSGNFIAGATCSSCILGACCTGGTCSGGGQTSQASCNGLFYPGATCRACDYGVYCTGATCFDLGYRNQSLTNNFITGATCSSCILGACCTGGTCLGGGQTSQAACLLAGGTFYIGATCFQCDMGVFCTGSNQGQTCFGLGHRGQSLTNNFISGGTCSSCILGACCTGGGCLGSGLTNQAACQAAGGLFYAGTTCVSCDYGVYCTGSDENTSCLGFGYKAQNLSNKFIISGSCETDCTYGACCDGITCLGITNQGNCEKPYSFFAGQTCTQCDIGLGACCTGGNSSITTIAGCQALNGIFFPEGTTALCVTGSCCTGGTCTQEIAGRSGNCQFFIQGTTCGICDSGVYCTGSTCFGTGFRGQSLTSNFIAGATCSSCILGICCTGGTCIGGGQTAQINCPSSIGTFVAGATQCSACDVKVNCCLPGGTCAYILQEQCLSQNGIVFAGEENCLLCQSGAFCVGRTCAGVTLFGFNLGNTFIADGDCGDCIYGTCCNNDYVASDTTKNNCKSTFYPGDYNPDICTQGITFGICCNGSTCSENVLQTDCTGYFVSDAVANANSLSCGSNACELGICCGENEITSVTGGVCLGVMTRAECAVTGGDFFPYTSSGIATGVTCSNCIYTPMISSLITEKIASNTTSTYGRTTQFSGSVTGFTGNEIQPRREVSSVTNTFVGYRDYIYYGAGATTTIQRLTRANNIGGSQIFQLVAQNFSDVGGTGWKVWYSGATLFNTGITSGSNGLTGIYDFSPVLNTGITNANNKIMGYIPGPGLIDRFEIPRYARLVLGYGNPSDDWHDTNLVYRLLEQNGNNNTTNIIWALNDATKHAQLQLNVNNIFPAITPFTESGTDAVYSSPILVQFFAENPLKYRVRPVGSCCVGATCIGIVTQDHCTFAGGTFYENGRCSRCYPNLVFGNCCVGGTHAGYTSLAACNNLSGTFFEGTTYENDVCIYGTICTEDKQCFQGISYSYYGSYSSTNNKFFIEQTFGSTLGCLACDAGLCCVGSTCMGRIPKVQCDALGGNLYYNETTCSTNCDTGVCCEIGATCGTYTNRANCYGTNQVFVAGATLGATCSACSSLLTLVSSGSGVTYTMVLNKGTTYGTFYDGSYWVQETSNLKLLKVKLQYPNAGNTATFEYAANTKISGITLNANGYKGSVYIHGCAKNPTPLSYIDKDKGVIPIGITTTQKFVSICYDDYPQGWGGPYSTNSTDVPSNYDGFNLQGFLDIMNIFKYTGMTLGASDVVMASASNFDITKGNNFPSNAGGYPYQVIGSRANTLAYGILNCLSATDAALAGSTLCFRPPNVWPEELRSSRPIYTISSLNNKVPGTSGNPLIILATSNADKNVIYDQNIAKTCAQASEFGDGVDYGIVTPMWAMGGPRVKLSSYGEQYITPLQNLLYAIHATGGNVKTLTFEQRRDGLARIVQYGIDSWGAQRTFALTLSSGAGQKAGRTRGWIPLAGYYIGETAMYDPEATMLSDTERINQVISHYYKSDPAITPGRTCSTVANWRVFRFGNTGSNNNYEGLRRFLARIASHEVNTMIEYIDDPSNLVRHYSYPGPLYRDTNISGFTLGGQTGITFYNSLRGLTLDVQKDIGIYGNLGTIRWGDGTTSANPYPNRFSAGLHVGSKPCMDGMWIKVESGPGSSGGQGSRYYRILYGTGFEDGTKPEPASFGGGYQIIIGQTWADGIPDHTSVLKLYPLSVEDVGVTRPSTFHQLGYTYGPVGFIINNNPTNCTSGLYNESTLFDANTSSTTEYFTTSLDAWAPQYLLADYIRKTKGVSLISDVAPIPDYIRQYVYTSPYNIKSLYSWYSGTNAVFNTWLGTTWGDANLGKQRINFAKHFPGVITWNGITV